MGQVFAGRTLESGLVDAVRRQALENGPDGPVLAGGIHGLEEENDSLPLFRVEFLLQFIYLHIVALQEIFCLIPVFYQGCLIGRNLADVEFFTAVITIMVKHKSHAPLQISGPVFPLCGPVPDDAYSIAYPPGK